MSLVGAARLTLFFSGKFVLLPSSQQSLQLAFGRFSAAYDQAGKKISTEKTEVLCLLKCPRQCVLQVSVQLHWGDIHE